MPLTIVHVLDMSGYRDNSSDFMRHLRTLSEKKLENLSQRAARHGATVDTVVLDGSPAVKLSEFTATVGARLLIVSTAGQIAPSQWLAGSVVDEIIQISSVPTLIVREPRSLEAWVAHTRPLNIMAAFDFSASSLAAIRWIASQESIGRCAVTAAYAASPLNERTRLQIAAPRLALYYPSSLKRLLEKEIQENIGGVLLNTASVCVSADWRRPGAQIIAAAYESRADLIVVGAGQRRGLSRLGSVSRAVSHYWDRNVAVVPETWGRAPISTATRDELIPVDFDQSETTRDNFYAAVA